MRRWAGSLQFLQFPEKFTCFSPCYKVLQHSLSFLDNRSPPSLAEVLIHLFSLAKQNYSPRNSNLQMCRFSWHYLVILNKEERLTVYMHLKRSEQ